MPAERASRSGYPNEYARDVTEDTYSEGSDSSVSYTPSSPSPSDISSTTAQRQWRLNNQQWAETQAREDAYQRAAQQNSQAMSKYDIQELRFGSLDSVDSDVSSCLRAVSTKTGDGHSAPMPPPSWPRTSKQALGSMRRPRKDDYLLETDDDSGVQPKRRKTNRSQHRGSDIFWDPSDHLGPSTPSSRISSSQMTTSSTGLHSTSPITNPPTPASRPAPTQDPRRLPNPTDTRNTPGLFMTPGPDEAVQQEPTGNSNAHHHHHPPPFPSTATNDPDDNPTHRARLRAMAANPKAHAYVRKRAPESDPENRQIKHLRQHDRRHWTDIADTLNAARVAAGLTPTFTVAAVYGRFARVAPRIAEAEGEEGFDHKDYLYFKQEAGAGGRERERRKAMPVLSRGEEELLAGCYEEVERERWVNLARKFKLRAGVELSPEQVARKFKTL